jgi:hypothetical protein
MSDYQFQKTAQPSRSSGGLFSGVGPQHIIALSVSLAFAGLNDRPEGGYSPAAEVATPRAARILQF